MQMTLGIKISEGDHNHNSFLIALSNFTANCNGTEGATKPAIRRNDFRRKEFAPDERNVNLFSFLLFFTSPSQDADRVLGLLLLLPLFLHFVSQNVFRLKTSVDEM